jgi:PERQ amino acid-rich with GYF domain-containing protein
MFDFEQGGTWPMIRSLSGPGIPGRGGRGGGRGGSVDRGRGRERGIYHYTRSSSLYDDDPRGAGRGERTWLERNKSGGLGLLGEGLDGSNSTSPRKEYGAYGRGNSTESWRRSRNDEEDWRSSGNSNRTEKWRKSKI